MLLKFWTYLGVIYYIGSSLFISNDLSNSNSGWVSNIGTSFFSTSEGSMEAFLPRG
ncbi:glutathione-regulated potassium-efflux system protein [Prevotella dentalis DSM 3688]|uniref:Glutathione-regulated potassium-efflux system protein n=1 Tax=Prevotella dentalis (strain ATCC 49559 / DSM 3688 / JCM 13448 / NCTC 12043 / ES 2772) TaxID=908937 RepID=F9D582_PREDD|nr:glutathione-regulated potassium-efflux system protein [Prevotella dentalis DSM 3688]